MTGPGVYTMAYRPVSTFTLPAGVVWTLTATPRNDPGWQRRRPDLPASRYNYELDQFQVLRVA